MDDDLPWDEKISGWKSAFRRGPDRLAESHELLLDLVGRRLTAGWTCAHPIFPVVLLLDDTIQLELGWMAPYRLSITCATIALTRPPHIGDRPYPWRRNEPAEVEALVGRALTGFARTDTPYWQPTEDVEAGFPLDRAAGWNTAGLWLGFGDGGLHLYEGIDDTRLAAEPIAGGTPTRVLPVDGLPFAGRARPGAANVH